MQEIFQAKAEERMRRARDKLRQAAQEPDTQRAHALVAEAANHVATAVGLQKIVAIR